MPEQIRRDQMPEERQTLVENLVTAAKAFDEANAALADWEATHGKATHRGAASYGSTGPNKRSPLKSKRLQSWARGIKGRGFSFD